jgi:Arc/MetJ family transcription regulator
MLDAWYMVGGISKHLVDLDEDALSAARAELGTTTIKDTVNEALRRAIEQRRPRVVAALDMLAAADLDDRADAWR